ncbi:hypothetical protein AAF712_013772 [Marasmius tenuissimus]|uniref:Uncharacterized protein n=1 Tax=Marasmius tenuissimus TaxID=585030 RepID=A0ABR2ZE22_9AGAR
MIGCETTTLNHLNHVVYKRRRTVVDEGRICNRHIHPEQDLFHKNDSTHNGQAGEEPLHVRPMRPLPRRSTFATQSGIPNLEHGSAPNTSYSQDHHMGYHNIPYTNQQPDFPSYNYPNPSLTDTIFTNTMGDSTGWSTNALYTYTENIQSMAPQYDSFDSTPSQRNMAVASGTVFPNNVNNALSFQPIHSFRPNPSDPAYLPTAVPTDATPFGGNNPHTGFFPTTNGNYVPFTAANHFSTHDTPSLNTSYMQCFPTGPNMYPTNTLIQNGYASSSLDRGGETLEAGALEQQDWNADPQFHHQPPFYYPHEQVVEMSPSGFLQWDQNQSDYNAGWRREERP